MNEEKETVDGKVEDKTREPRDVKLIVFSALGFLGLDKFYKNRVDLGIIKIVALIGIPFVLSVLSELPYIGWTFWIANGLYGLIALAWYVLDIVFASLGKYQMNPLDYLKRT